MTTDLDTYRQRLLIELRRRGVPGDRIGEAIAEVESHVAESGEDPVTAFGEPDAYAERLSGSLRLPDRSGARWARWANAVVAAGSFAAAGMVTTAIVGDGAVAERVATAVAGLVVMAGVLAWAIWYQRRATNRIVDPRTCTDMRFPLPRAALVTFAGAMVALLVIMLIVR
jgi:hypothetical protein